MDTKVGANDPPNARTQGHPTACPSPFHLFDCPGGDLAFDASRMFARTASAPHFVPAPPYALLPTFWWVSDTPAVVT